MSDLPEQVSPRQRLIGSLKTLGWVVVITLLIWVYAERAEVGTTTATFGIMPGRSVDRDTVVTLNGSGQITATLSGQQGRLGTVAEELKRQGTTIDVDPTLPAGDHVVKVAALLTDTELLSKDGITVTEAHPESVVVHVEKMIEQEAEVRLPEGIAGQVTSAAFEPKTVKVRGPKTVLDAARPLFVYADLSGDQLKPLPKPSKDTTALLRLPLALAGNPNVTISQLSVHAAYEVRQSSVRRKIDSMAVFLISPPGLLDKYRAVYPADGPTVKNVEVIGPPEQIQKLDNHTFIPKAFIEVSADDAKDHPARALKRFDLPEGVELAPDAPTPTFMVKLEPISPE